MLRVVSPSCTVYESTALNKGARVNVGLLDTYEKEKWQRLLSTIPASRQDIYFTPAYYDLYEKNGDGHMKCFVFQFDGELALYPFLINKVNSLELIEQKDEWFDIQGAYGYNGVVSTSDEAGFVNAFYGAFDDYCRKNNIIAEFTRFHPLLGNHQFSKSNMELFFDRQTVSLDLSKGYEYVWKNCYSSKNRNMIRKAKKHGTNHHIITTGERYEKFYHLYSATMKRIMADRYYMFPNNYFDNFVKAFGENQFLVDVELDGATIASVLVMLHGKFAHYHLSARDESYSIGANNLALDLGIKLTIEKGCERFHFGGGHTPNPEDTLLRFKKSFSKDTHDFVIGKRIHNREVYNDICLAWEKKHPAKKEQYANILLKYRR